MTSTRQGKEFQAVEWDNSTDKKLKIAELRLNPLAEFQHPVLGPETIFGFVLPA
jgi:hypothetical protein